MGLTFARSLLLNDTRTELTRVLMDEYSLGFIIFNVRACGMCVTPMFHVILRYIINYSFGTRRSRRQSVTFEERHVRTNDIHRYCEFHI